MNPRVLCDTNVLVSAFIAGGPPSRVIETAIEGRIDLVLAVPVMDELARVLTVKLGLERHRVREIDSLLEDLAHARVPAPTAAPAAVTGDLDDDVILACAVLAKVGFLVSGDRRHLLPIGLHEGVKIVSPSALLAEVSGVR